MSDDHSLSATEPEQECTGLFSDARDCPVHEPSASLPASEALTPTPELPDPIGTEQEPGLYRSGTAQSIYPTSSSLSGGSNDLAFYVEHVQVLLQELAALTVERDRLHRILTAGDSDNPIQALNTHGQTGTCLEHGSQLSSGKGHAGISPQASGPRDQAAERPAVRSDLSVQLTGAEAERDRLTAEVVPALEQEILRLQRARIGDAEIIGRWMCQTEQAESSLLAWEATVGQLKEENEKLKKEWAARVGEPK